MLDFYREFPLSSSIFFSSPLRKSTSATADSWEPKFWTLRDPDTRDVTVMGSVAGLNEKDLKLEVLDNVLRISGTRHLLGQEAQSFERSYELSKLDTNAIKATLKDGILTVKIPVAEASKPRTVKLMTQ